MTETTLYLLGAVALAAVARVVFEIFLRARADRMIKDLRSESEEIAMRRLVLKWTHERLSDSRGKPEVAMKDPDFYRNLPKSIAEKARMMDKDRIASIKDQGRPR